MNNYASWLIESGISLSIFYLAYRIFLNRENLFQSNRGFLLFALLFSVALPFIQIPSPIQEIHYTHYLPAAEVTANMTIVSSETGKSFSLLQMLWYVYLTGAAFMFAAFVFRLSQLIRTIRNNPFQKNGKIRIVTTNFDHSPFSFLHFLVINDHYLSTNDKEKIIEHESVHIRQFHTIDILIVELLSILQWFNPFIWLYKSSLKELHEYLADREVIKKGTTIPVYQQILLNFQLSRRFFTLVNNFNYSLTKKRFIMMTKSKSSLFAWIKLFLLLPFLTLLLVSMTNINVTKSGLVHDVQLNNSMDIKVDQTDYDINSFTHNGDITLVPQIRYENELPPPKPPAKVQENEDTDKKGEEEIFIIVEQMPKFNEADDKGSEFRKYIAENLKYPKEAAKAGIQGRVFVQFTVDNQGVVKDAKVIRFINIHDGKVMEVETLKDGYKLIAAEALRIVESSPKWIPGKQRGKAVNVQFTFPIAFILNNEQSEKTVPVTSTEKPSSQDIFVMVEEMPNFMGEGSQKFRDFIAENLKYPEEARKNGIQGRVFIQFVIDSEGKIKDVTVVRGVHELLDAEAIRVVESSYDWTPGKQRGKPVNVRMTFPILFSLGE